MSGCQSVVSVTLTKVLVTIIIASSAKLLLDRDCLVSHEGESKLESIDSLRICSNDGRS